ncbi:TPA: hypothetical protein ACHSD2_003228, partial [Listeria monocytogenes]
MPIIATIAVMTGSNAVKPISNSPITTVTCRTGAGSPLNHSDTFCKTDESASRIGASTSAIEFPKSAIAI